MNDMQWLNQMVESWEKTARPEQLKVENIHQGWGQLRFGRDTRNNPMRSGGRNFERGFGTHADSRIRIHSAMPLARLQVFGGAAENDYTLSHAEQVPGMIFSVEADGRVLRQSPLLSFGELAEFDLALEGATTFDLVIQAPDGSGFGHANWCEPLVETVEGEQIRCGGEILPAFPVTFHYGNETFQEFACRNGIRHLCREEEKYFLHEFITETETLRMTFSCKAYRNFPVLEWHLSFDNPSLRRSERLSRVRSLEMVCKPAGSPRLLRHHGAFHRNNEPFTANAFRDSFRPVWWEPNQPESLLFGAVGGRPSVDWMPYFDLSDGGGNWRIAIGWAGQWSADIAWDGQAFRINAGMETFDAVLEPGEHFEFPSILLQRTTGGGREKAVNLWRRFVTAEIMLPLDGAPPAALVCSNTWGGRNERQHLRKIHLQRQERMLMEVYWIDAGWFAPESLNEFSPVWSENVGDWKFDPDAYPHGLRKIADAVHADGQKLLLWLEPERVRTDRHFAAEHPEYLIFNETPDALLDLGNPAAWEHCFKTLSGIIEENRIDWLRIDFNFSPLPYWQSRDTVDRQGVTELRYVNGLYKLWRELRRKFPHLMIDNCASGGRRLDFELLRYSLPLWYSDMQCFTEFAPRHSLTHLAGMADYWPRFAGGVQNQAGGDTYNFRASINHGVVIHYDYTKEFEPAHFPHRWLRERLAEYQKIRDCFAGDFYELNPPSPEESGWGILQYDLPEEQRGVITVFRGENCPEVERLIRPRGIHAECNYLVSDADDSFEPFQISGSEWMHNGFRLRLEQPRTARLIHYRQQR